jgi:thiol-disulfide isomerase/thioredoxin
MKEIIKTLSLFLGLCIAFSAITSCGGTTPNAAVKNSAATPAPVNAASPIANTAGYPPLASGLADTDLELISGGTFKISERKGKAVLLNIWGTWCGPCRAEMPHLIEMQDKYRERGFEVIGLNIGDGGGGAESNEMITKFA